MWASIIKWVGHWLVYFVLSAIVGWIIYAGLIRPVIKPNPTTTQTGGVAYNYTIHLGMMSCARIPDPKPNLVTPIIEKAKEIKEVITK